MKRISGGPNGVSRVAGALFAFLVAGVPIPGQSEMLPAGSQQVSVAIELDPAGREFQGLMVEWDALDVTAFAGMSGNQLTVSLPAPVGPGDHQLVVMAFYANGDIDLISDATFSVEASAGLASSRWGGVATVDARWRAGGKDDNDFDGIDASRQVVSVKAGTDSQAGNWRVETLVGATHDSDATGTGTGEHAEMNQFEVRATLAQDQWRHQLAAGDLQLGQDGLVFSQYQRRGVRASTRFDERVGVAAFAVNSEASTRADGDLVWPDDEGEKVQGATLDISPFAGDNAGLLGLSFSWLEGETPYGGLNNFEDGVLYGGDMQSVQLNSRLLGDVLTLSGEYAESSFDQDGINNGEGEETDHATRWQMVIAPGSYLPRFGLDLWSLTVGESDVGTDFYSLGNLYLAGDMLTRSQALMLGKGGLQLTFENQTQENNRNDVANVPTQEGERRGVSFTYTPLFVDISQGIWQTIGQPVLSGYHYDSAIEQDFALSKQVQFDVNNETTEQQLALQLSGQTRSIMLSQSWVYYDDHSREIVNVEAPPQVLYQPQGDSTSTMTVLQFSWYPTSRWMLTPSVQRNRVHQDLSGDIYRSTSWGLDFDGQLLVDTLFLQINYNTVTDRTETDNLLAKSDTDTQSSQYTLTWRWRQASGVRPAVDFYTQGQHGVYEDHVYDGGDETWQVHVGVKLNWEKPQ